MSYALKETTMLDLNRRAELADHLGEDFVEELTSSFWSDCWGLLDFGVTAIVSNDTDELGKVLHTLSGSAGNLGFSGIARAAEAANIALKRGVIPDLIELQVIMLRTSALTQYPLGDADYAQSA